MPRKINIHGRERVGLPGVHYDGTAITLPGWGRNRRPRIGHQAHIGHPTPWDGERKGRLRYGSKANNEERLFSSPVPFFCVRVERRHRRASGKQSLLTHRSQRGGGWGHCMPQKATRKHLCGSGGRRQERTESLGRGLYWSFHGKARQGGETAEDWLV